MTYDFRPVADTPAFGVLKEWITKNIASGFYTDDVKIYGDGTLGYCYHRSDFSEFNPLDLFEFFDSVGIYGFVSPCFSLEDDNTEFDIGIKISSDEMQAGEIAYPSRSAATVALFDRCFEILNERMKA